MTAQLFNLCELQQIHATDFASEGSSTVGIVFIRITCNWPHDFPNMVMTLLSKSNL